MPTKEFSAGRYTLAVALNGDIYGVIYLKDIVKPGIRERFDQLRRMGVRTIMLTGITDYRFCNLLKLGWMTSLRKRRRKTKSK